MGQGNMFDNGQPQTRATDLAAAAGINPVKPLKDPGQVFRGDARALVPDPDNYLGSFPLGFHLNHPPGSLNLTALSTRFTRACSSRGGLIWARRSSGQFSPRAIFFSAALAPQTWMALCRSP